MNTEHRERRGVRLRRLRLLSAIAAMVSLAASLSPFGRAELRPNIIVLLADDLSWVDTSVSRVCMGYASGYHETPNLERLADQGLAFSYAYTLQNCKPARIALLTGQYAPRNNAYNNGSLNRLSEEQAARTAIVPPGQQDVLSADAVSLGELLSSVGYETAIFGKTHGFESPASLGEHHGFRRNMSVDKRFRFEYQRPGWKAIFRHDYLAIEDESGGWHFTSPEYDAFAAPYDRAYVEKQLLPFAVGSDPRSLLRNPKHPTPKHLTDGLTDAVEAYIAEMAAEEEPFFIYLAYHAVHSYFVARPDLEAKFVRKDSEDRRHNFATYAAMLANLDESVGRIMRRLEDPNRDGEGTDSIANRTVVIFLSDNGGSDNTDNSPLRGRKGMFREGGIRVPLVIRDPTTSSSGKVSAEPVHIVDLYPTIAEMAEAPLPSADFHPVDGVSILGLLEGAKRLKSRAIFWHFPGYMDERQVPNSVALARIGDDYFKLYYYYESGRFELYNLADDIAEERNLIGDGMAERHRSIAEDLSRQLADWLGASGAKMGHWRESGKAVEYPAVFRSKLAKN